MPNTYTELRRTTVGTATPSVTLNLSGISGYTDLVLVISGTNTTSAQAIGMTFNGDTTTNYSRTALYGTGSGSALSLRDSSVSRIDVAYYGTTQGDCIVHIMNYANATTFKTTISRSNDSASALNATVGLWRKTPEPITSITLTAVSTNIAIGSTFSLYGIANADQGAAKATGGIITEDSQYWYHTFGATSAFIPKQSLTCDVLAIAGGGGGGRYGGGGGAGGYRLLTSQSFSVTSHTVTVGGGGTGGTGNDGGVGSVSSVNGISANIGGGGGGYAANAPTGTLGSGGGAGYPDGANTTGAAGTSGQGFAGGNATNGHFAGGGGGGADSVGGVSTSGRVGGNGGTAIAVPSAWLSATSIGISGFIAGGGGGCGQNGAGTATGGGGIGATNNNGTTGRPNTGGGGGGGYAATGGTNANGFAGGSGVVVIRYAK
jgi:hypothetical protein